MWPRPPEGGVLVLAVVIAAPSLVDVMCMFKKGIYQLLVCMVVILCAGDTVKYDRRTPVLTIAAIHIT